ncbi:MAG: TRM11 family SAM-dependent methyltransferase [Acidothermaceae bacterium]
MNRYALLILAATNRVYTESSVALTQAELAVFAAEVLGGAVSEIEAATIGGVHYVTFVADALDAREIALLSNLSSVHALFAREGDLLRPLTLHKLDRFDDDLITIQKYSGKTNEQFTKLLLNVTLLATSFASELLDRRFHVLDPLCGRGTTLNQAMMYGFNASGVEIDRKDFEAYSSFAETWLKRKRIKHRLHSGPVRRDKRLIGRRFEASFAASKDDFKAGALQRLDVVNADTTQAGEFFQPATFDVIVTDAPYGVQHGSRTSGKGLARSPIELLREAVPKWAGLLRSGGAIGISWNTNVTRRDELVKVLATAGLDPLDAGAYSEFEHRVDQAIVRDVIVARKP